jgi:hypothetical protein
MKTTMAMKNTTQTSTLATLFHQTSLPLLGTVTTVMSLAVLSVPIPPASAGIASGCTPAPYGLVCINALSNGTTIARVKLERGKGEASLICDYKGTVSITSPTGKILWSRTASRQQCTPVYAWFEWDVSRSFPSGSRICSSFYEGGVKQGGSPCLTVKP